MQCISLSLGSTAKYNIVSIRRNERPFIHLWHKWASNTTICSLEGFLYWPFSPSHLFSNSYSHATAAVFYWKSWVLTTLFNDTSKITRCLWEIIIFLKFPGCKNLWYSIQNKFPVTLHATNITIKKIKLLNVCLSVPVECILRCWRACVPSMTDTFTESPDRWKSHHNVDDTEPLMPAGRGPLQLLHRGKTCHDPRVCSSPYGGNQLTRTNGLHWRYTDCKRK